MIRVVRSIEEFRCLQSKWSKLLAKSNANDLFMSWDWLFSWWKVWGENSLDSLNIVLIEQKNDVVGIVPMMLSNGLSIPYFPGKRLQFIGSHWKHYPSIRTECFSPIFDMDYEDEAKLEFKDYLSSIAVCDEICICDSINCSFMMVDKSLQSLNSDTSKLWQNDICYYINTEDGLTEYKASLGRNTRKKYFNDQKKLQEQEINNTINECDFINVCNYLNGFHSIRWNNKVFNRDVIRFYSYFFSISEHSKAKFYLLKNKNGKVLSIVFCIKNLTTLYYIQSGFAEEKLPFALGKVHMGIVIIDAFLDKHTQKLNLLAGHGKSSDYKKFLTSSYETFDTFSIFITQKAKLSHKLVDSLRSIKKRIL